MDTDAGAGIVAHLRALLPTLGGTSLAGRRVREADDFAYDDPVDGSRSERQGIRVLFEDGSRIVYRLSGTGTEGATLRVYVESFEPDSSRHGLDPKDALRPLVEGALALAEVERRTGRTAPTVIT